MINLINGYTLCFMSLQTLLWLTSKVKPFLFYIPHPSPNSFFLWINFDISIAHAHTLKSQSSIIINFWLSQVNKLSHIISQRVCSWSESNSWGNDTNSIGKESIVNGIDGENLNVLRHFSFSFKEVRVKVERLSCIKWSSKRIIRVQGTWRRRNKAYILFHVAKIATWATGKIRSGACVAMISISSFCLRRTKSSVQYT